MSEPLWQRLRGRTTYYLLPWGTRSIGSRLPWRFSVTGIVGGMLSGLLGIGGGIAMVPLMVLWLAQPQRRAHAMSLAAIIPISVSALLVYGHAGKVNVRAAVALVAGSVVGARLGAILLSRAPERLLKGLFGVFLIAAAALIAARG